jgi:hypothetical protein
VQVGSDRTPSFVVRAACGRSRVLSVSGAHLMTTRGRFAASARRSPPSAHARKCTTFPRFADAPFDARLPRIDSRAVTSCARSQPGGAPVSGTGGRRFGLKRNRAMRSGRQSAKLHDSAKLSGRA